MLRRIVLFGLAVFLFCGSVSCARSEDFVSVAYTVKLDAEAAFVYDCNDGCVSVVSKDGENPRVYPASITKLLTALVALDTLPAATVITPGDEVYIPGANASTAYIRPHHSLTLEMLIEGMLIPSGNDAAYAIAAACGRAIAEDGELDYQSAVEVFVGAMNEYAASLGCTDTHCTTPDGYAGDEHYSTLADMSRICRAAMENATILRYAAMPSDDVVYASGHTNTWVNTNRQLDADDAFYNESVIGLKTGSLSGNYSLVTLYDNGENRFLIGVFGASSDKARYRDTAVLIEGELEAQAMEAAYQGD